MAPPVTTMKVPIEAAPMPITYLLDRRSFNMMADKVEMRTGESKQTRIEAIDALAI